jgi:cytochrome bd-type quinol oxidase subunit 1/mono/diheme cytochrome c family protein
MNYPVWDVPIFGSGWVIGIIAVLHVLVSHFAIGGGLYLVLAEKKALREGRKDWMEHLKGHAKFFLILTSAFGAVSGVGIWFAIGLANPEATSTLIHNFVFGWAIEWTFFVVEVTSALVYYYTWDRIPSKTHVAVGWVYAGSAWLSLVIINGILTFMLTPGDSWLAVAGTGHESSRFWQGFFNPTYFPSLFLRTTICASLAGVWALLTASRIDGEARADLKKEVLRWSVRWLLPSFVLLPPLFLWYLSCVPDSQRALLMTGISTIGMGTFTQVTRVAMVTVMTSATILAIVYFLAWRNPSDFSPGHAGAVLFLALAATGSTELGRELLRKPYVIGQHMYSNGVRKNDGDAIDKRGFLTSSPWATDAERAAWASGTTTTPELKLLRGELMFRGECMNCHTLDGYRAMKTFVHGRDRSSIGNLLAMLHKTSGDSPYKAFMPRLVGTDAEIDALGDYLETLANPIATKPPR